MEPIVGREREQAILANILASSESELVAVYGRRRVGKTYLIRNYFEKQLIFEVSGIHHATLREQLNNFASALSAHSGLSIERARDWAEAFRMLQQYLTPLLRKQKKVIFLDEFPWLQTSRSGFLSAFENFWNNWASRQQNLVVILCGSAAAWMIRQVVNNRVGLHNRVTRRIRLLPFTIGEVSTYLKTRKINLDQYQILQIYMAMGGIPQYLKAIQPSQSAMEIIDENCFTDDGFLREEFKNLFYSLFDNAKDHLRIIRALAKKGKGLTRNEIIEQCKLSSGGGATQVIEELSESGFIAQYIPFGKQAKDIVYRLIDQYSLFYIKFIEEVKFAGKGSWTKFAVGSSWKSWSGIAFENICILHELQIKRALGIESVHTETSVWRFLGDKDEKGVQIDMVIDRQDQCINICEMKFSTVPYEITKAYSDSLRNKINTFQIHSKKKKALFLTMITTYGIKNESAYPGLIQAQLTMDVLFR